MSTQNSREARELGNLAAKMKAGDEQASRTLYNKLVRKVFGFCMSRLSNRAIAEDLTQEIFLKLVNGLHTFDPNKGSFVTWFWQLARNTLIDHFRKPREASFIDIENEEEGSSIESLAVHDPHPTLEARLAMQDLHRTLEKFSDDEKELFTLRFLADLSYQEISVLLDRPEGALRVATVRLKKKIKKDFEESL